jgi:hypothetical protein
MTGGLMTKICWITDPHFNFLRAFGATAAFAKDICKTYDPEALIITGDIAEGHNIEGLLVEFAEGVDDRPVYWLEGNHDYYKASISKMQERFRELDMVPNLFWLDTAEPVLFDDFALVGKYAWYDGLSGNPQRSPVALYDFSSVGEFKRLYNEYDWEFMAHTGSRNPLLNAFRKLAAEAVAEVRPKLEQALKLKRHVVFATHVAPFEGAAWHEGKISNPDWLPWFSCRQMGDMLAEVAAQHPDHKILVLCGHSHSPGKYQHAPNLKVLTGNAAYGAPDVAGILTDPFEEW